MDPKLQALLLQIAQQAQFLNNPVVAQDIQRYIASGGTTPLSTATLAQVEPRVRAAGLTLLPPQGAVPPGQGRLGGDPNRPSINHDPNGQPTGLVPPGPAIPPIPTVPAGTTGGPRVNSPVEGNVPELGAVAGPSGTPLTPPAAQQAYAISAADRGRATPGAPGSGSTGNPGGFGNVTAGALAEDDDYLLRFAMQSAGFNPDIITPGSRIAAQKLAPMVSARRNVYGLMDPNGGNEGGLPQDIAQFAHDFTDKGTNFYQNAADYGKQILSGAGFANIGGVADQEKRMAMYQALIPLLFGGANPLVQQSAGDQTKKLFNLYKDADIRGGDQGKSTIFEDFVKQYAGMNPLLKSIFGNIR